MAFGKELLARLSSAKEFSQIRNILASVNTNNASSKSLFFNDQINLGSTANLRRIIDATSKIAFREKDEYLGITLSSEEVQIGKDTTLEIYVDVPGFDFEQVGHPDNVDSDLEFEFSKVEHKIFYPESSRMLDNNWPSPGDIVRVRIPPDFFITSITDPLEMKYLGIFLKISPIGPSPDGLTPEERELLSPENRRRSLYDPKFRAEGDIREQDKIRQGFWSNFFTTVEGKKISMPRGLPNFSSLQALRARPRGVKNVLKNRNVKDAGKSRVDTHYGVDIATPSGTEIYAPFNLEIVYSEFQDMGGEVVVGVTDRYSYSFAHLRERKVAVGQKITKGQLIGISGDTGSAKGAPHLHFEIRVRNDKVIRRKWRAVNPLYFFNFQIDLSRDLQEGFGLNSLTLPLIPQDPSPAVATTTGSTASSPAKAAAAAEPAPQPQFRSTPSGASVPKGHSASLPLNKPRMALVDFPVDQAIGVKFINKIGAKLIKVREDIVPDLLIIKEKLNQYNIPLTCEFIDSKLNSNNISLLAKVGLEINLNINSALTLDNNLETDDYFVGPNYSYPVGNGYKLIIYANVRRNLDYYNEAIKPKKEIIEVYDIKNKNLNGSLKTKKILKNIINLTELFENYGFIPVLPKQEFFLTGDILKSNWNIFQKPSKIVLGYSYKELLSTVYINNNEPIWRLPELKWDGNKFI